MAGLLALFVSGAVWFSGNWRLALGTLGGVFAALVVLALAGSPVRATRLRVSPFVLATSIRVHDSLLEGASLRATDAALRDLVVEHGTHARNELQSIDDAIERSAKMRAEMEAENAAAKTRKKKPADIEPCRVGHHDRADTEWQVRVAEMCPDRE